MNQRLSDVEAKMVYQRGCEAGRIIKERKRGWRNALKKNFAETEKAFGIKFEKGLENEA